jgi:hypothetical protein
MADRLLRRLFWRVTDAPQGDGADDRLSPLMDVHCRFITRRYAFHRSNAAGLSSLHCSRPGAACKGTRTLPTGR